MNILDTAAEIALFLDSQQVPYAVIGGLAVQYWGDARTTRDVDIVVLVSADKMTDFLETAVHNYKPRIEAFRHLAPASIKPADQLAAAAFWTQEKTAVTFLRMERFLHHSNRPG